MLKKKTLLLARESKKFIFAVDTKRVVNHTAPVESLSYQFSHRAVEVNDSGIIIALGFV